MSIKWVLCISVGTVLIFSTTSEYHKQRNNKLSNQFLIDHTAFYGKRDSYHTDILEKNEFLNNEQIRLKSLPQDHYIKDKETSFTPLATLPNIPLDEFYALWDLHRSTQGEFWKYRKNQTLNGIPWDFTPYWADLFASGAYQESQSDLYINMSRPNPCEERWQGIQCTCTNSLPFHHYLATYYYYDDALLDDTPDCRLEKLSLVYYNLTGTIPHTIGNFPELSALNLAWGQITGSLPSTLGNLRRLERFAAGYNFLTGTLPPEISNCSLLHTMFVGINQLSGTLPPDYFTKLTTLDAFYVYKNRLTGTIPPEITLRTDFVALHLYNNMLTGSLPENMGALKNIGIVALMNNRLTGSIPASMGDMSGLRYLMMQNNRFSGSLSPSLGNLTALNHLDLSNNRLTGSLPSTFLQLTDIHTYFLSNNAFSGDLNHFVSSETQPALVNLDVSSNQFTGTIPFDLFKIGSLNTIAMVKNCIKGEMSPLLCRAHNLTVLALDGLSTATVCQHSSFRLNPRAKHESYQLKHQVTGGLPSCLFNMSRLQVLHLSGNGIDGSIPRDVQIGENMVDLSLSHNTLSGTIPQQIQTHPWRNLDLANNKISGSLHSDFYPMTSNDTLHLAVNRLTGPVPGSLETAANIDILDGNIFSCGFDRATLPRADKTYAQYQCGSNSFYVSAFVWCGLAGLVVLICAVYFAIRCHRNSNSSSKSECDKNNAGTSNSRSISSSGDSAEESKKFKSMSSMRHSDNNNNNINKSAQSSVVDKVYQFFGSFVLAEPHLCHVAFNAVFLGKTFDKIRLVFISLAVYCVGVFTPLYLALNFIYSTHEMQYVWIVSGSYLSSRTPAILLMVWFGVFICFLFALWARLKPEITVKYAETDLETAGSSKYSLKPKPKLLNDTSAKSILNNSNANNDGSKDDNSNSRLNWQNTWYYTKICIATVTFFVVITVINVFYIFIALNFNRTVVVVTQIALAGFKIFWNNATFCGIIYCTKKNRVHALTAGSNSAHHSRDSSMRSMSTSRLVNSAHIDSKHNGNSNISSSGRVKDHTHLNTDTPDPDLCDVNNPLAFRASSNIVLHSVMAIFNNIVSPCLATAVISSQCFYYAIYSPRAVQVPYDFTTCFMLAMTEDGGCSDGTAIQHFTQTTSYTPPFQYRYQCSSEMVSYYAAVYMYMFVIVILYNAAKTITLRKGLKAIHGDKCNLAVSDVPTSMFFHKESFIVSIVNYISILITFGVLFPPLAVVILVAVFANTHFIKLNVVALMSRLADRGDAYCAFLRLECLDLFASFYRVVWLWAMLGACFYAFFVFDTLGDAEGWRAASWAPITMIVIPSVVWVVSVLVTHRRRVLRKAGKAGDIRKDRGDAGGDNSSSIRKEGSKLGGFMSGWNIQSNKNQSNKTNSVSIVHSIQSSLRFGNSSGANSKQSSPKHAFKGRSGTAIPMLPLQQQGQGVHGQHGSADTLGTNSTMLVSPVTVIAPTNNSYAVANENNKNNNSSGNNIGEDEVLELFDCESADHSRIG